MAYFIPEPVEPFRVRVIGGRFEGAVGKAVSLFEDGIYSIETDDPSFQVAPTPPGKAYASKEEIELLLIEPLQ